jgi:hypothetical protein
VEYAQAVRSAKPLISGYYSSIPPRAILERGAVGKHDLVKTPDGAFEFGWIQMNGDYVPGLQ